LAHGQVGVPGTLHLAGVSNGWSGRRPRWLAHICLFIVNARSSSYTKVTLMCRNALLHTLAPFPADAY